MNDEHRSTVDQGHGAGRHMRPEEDRILGTVRDPEDLCPPRPRISRKASLALVLVLSAVIWALILAVAWS